MLNKITSPHKHPSSSKNFIFNGSHVQIGAAVTLENNSAGEIKVDEGNKGGELDVEVHFLKDGFLC